MKELLSGIAASLGTATGKPIIIESMDNVPDDLIEGFILVAPMTTPDYVPLFRKAIAVVTENGGRTCHAAIISRELRIPCVVGAKGAIKILKDQQRITVDGHQGKVFA